MAYAALEEAAVDLALRRAGTSLVDALASLFGPRHPSVAWCAVVGLRDDTPTLVDEIRIALEAGAAQVKLKIVPGRDVDVVRSVRDAYPDVALAVDANGSYGSPSMVPSELSSFGLAYLEQPVAPDDLRAASAVAEDLGVPVALDESITSLARLVEALELDACSVVSVKPARLGGLVETVRVLQQAESAGLEAFVGGMLETGIGRAIALAVAAQSPCTLPTDVGPTARYFAEDVTEGFEPNAERRMQAPSGPGIGVVPDEDALERFTRRPGDATPMTTWSIERLAGDARALHERDALAETAAKGRGARRRPRRRWCWAAHSETRSSMPTRHRGCDVDVARRRTGGGAVFLSPR